MAEPTTTVAQVRFELEQEGDRPYIRLEQQYVPGVAALRYGALRFDLDPEVTPEEARDLTHLLNAKIHSLIFTGEDPARRDEG